MSLSWGTRLPEELLLLVKTALGVDFLCPPPLPHPQSSLFPPISLSFYTSPIIPLLLLVLLLLIHWQAPPASSLLLFSKPTPPPHPFILSSLCSSLFSKDSVNQTESQRRVVYPAGAWTCRGPCSGDGTRDEGRSRRGYWNTHAHTWRTSVSILPSSLFMYLSFRFTGQRDVIMRTIICLLTAFDRQRGRLRWGAGALT